MDAVTEILAWAALMASLFLIADMIAGDLAWRRLERMARREAVAPRQRQRGEPRG